MKLYTIHVKGCTQVYLVEAESNLDAMQQLEKFVVQDYDYGAGELAAASLRSGAKANARVRNFVDGRTNQLMWEDTVLQQVEVTKEFK